MFQACAVKIAKMDAHSAPIWLPGKARMNRITVKVRKPSTGTDCRMSSAGTITSSALRLLAARVATTKVKTSDATIAANMRKVVRSAYSGRLRVSSVTGARSSFASGWPISRAAWVTSTKAAMMTRKMTQS